MDDPVFYFIVIGFVLSVSISFACMAICCKRRYFSYDEV